MIEWTPREIQVSGASSLAEIIEELEEDDDDDLEGEE